jgi:hypothetical protein
MCIVIKKKKRIFPPHKNVSGQRERESVITIKSVAVRLLYYTHLCVYVCMYSIPHEIIKHPNVRHLV